MLTTLQVDLAQQVCSAATKLINMGHFDVSTAFHKSITSTKEMENLLHFLNVTLEEWEDICEKGIFRRIFVTYGYRLRITMILYASIPYSARRKLVYEVLSRFTYIELLPTIHSRRRNLRSC